MIMVKYSAGSLMLWTYYFVGGPGHLVLIQNLKASARNLITGCGWIFH